jgi:hypothetical protein
LQQQASAGASGACCVVAASKHWSFWSLLRCSKQASFEEAPELAALLASSNKTNQKKSKHLT